MNLADVKQKIERLEEIARHIDAIEYAIENADDRRSPSLNWHQAHMIISREMALQMLATHRAGLIVERNNLHDQLGITA